MSLKIDIAFECECGEQIEETVDAPYPDFSADKMNDSTTESWDSVYCPNCNKEINVNINNSYYEATCCIDGKEIENVSEPYDSDYEQEINWLVEESEQLEIFVKQKNSILELLEVSVEGQCEFDFHVMLYGYLIAAFESYLSSTFIHHVANSDEMIRKLIETDPSFQNQKLTFNKLFVELDKIKKTVAKYLNKTIFHQIDKVQKLYSNVLDVHFDVEDWLRQAIETRHDCVHRAGFDKDSQKIEIDRNIIRDLAIKLYGLAESISAQILVDFSPEEVEF